MEGQKDILHHLLDMATEVPGLLALSDAFKEAKITSVMLPLSAGQE
jgi:hypothetical protein